LLSRPRKRVPRLPSRGSDDLPGFCALRPRGAHPAVRAGRRQQHSRHEADGERRQETSVEPLVLPSALLTLSHFSDKAVTANFDQVEDFFKAFWRAVIGIRNVTLQEGLDPMRLMRCCQLPQRAKMAPVHGQNQIEILQIRSPDLSGTEAGEIVAAARCGLHCPWIGRFPGVKTMSASRIYK